MRKLNRDDRLRLVKFLCSFAWADLRVHERELYWLVADRISATHVKDSALGKALQARVGALAGGRTAVAARRRRAGVGCRDRAPRARRLGTGDR